MSTIPPTPGTPTMSGSSMPPTATPRASSRRIRPRIAAATLATAAVGGLLVWAAAVPLGGLDHELAAAGQHVGPASIIGAVLIGGAAAWLLLALLIRLRRGRAWWTAVAVAVLVLSLTGPPLSGAGGPVLVTLELMHLVVGIVLILGLRRSAVRQVGAGRTVIGEAS